MTDETQSPETTEETEAKLAEQEVEATPEAPEVEIAPDSGDGEEPKATASQPEPPMAGDLGDVPVNPNLLGELEPGELAVMTTLRQQMRKIQNDVGGLEIQKARLIGHLSQVEGQLENHLNMTGQRLGVPQGTQFQVGPDGKCWRMPQPGQMPSGLRVVSPGATPVPGGAAPPAKG